MTTKMEKRIRKAMNKIFGDDVKVIVSFGVNENGDVVMVQAVKHSNGLNIQLDTGKAKKKSE